MISVYGKTDRGIARRSNQDACACAVLGPKRAWGVVCDGMGGANAGDIASRMAVAAFGDSMEKLKSILPHFREGDLLVKAAEDANADIFRRAQSDPACEGMGTTMVGALIWDKTLWVVNVGDSRAYLIRKEEIRRLTRDHSVVEDLIAQGKVTPQQARRHPQRNLITRALGTTARVRADLFRDTAHKGDVLLLCSDGLVNEVTDEEICRDILAGGTPEEMTDRLLERTLKRGAPDNVTIVLFQLK